MRHELIYSTEIYSSYLRAYSSFCSNELDIGLLFVT